MTESAIEPFLRNGWYVAAWSEELDKGMVTRVIMNEPLVIYRDLQGKAGAMEDRCCHRGAPLSEGKVVENGLQCGYHGLVFDASGKCVEIPGQANIPAAAKVRAYKVVERQQFVWIWMGDPALADESRIIDYPWHDQPSKWPHRKAVMNIKCNYMMLVDNLMDLTHLGYVHTKTIGGNPKAHVDAQMDVTRTDHGAHYIRWMMNSKPPPTYVKGAGFTGNIDRWQEFEYFLPGSIIQWSGGLPVGTGAKENREQDGFHLRIYHGMTPATENTCYYFWSTANGYRQDDPQATEEMYNEVYPTFVEDISILEGQQDRISREPGRPLVAIKADVAMTHARRAMRAALDAEQGHRAEAAE